MINVALIDDHVMFRTGIKHILEIDPNFRVSIEASNGQEFLNQLKTTRLPDIAVIDINMPVMNGFQTLKALNSLYPSIKAIILTMVHGEDAVINMINHGACAYISKNEDPSQLSCAILDVYYKGIYFGDLLTRTKFRKKNEQRSRLGFAGVHYLTPREVEFIKLSATELTYAEIAVNMKIGTKTAENYKDRIFQKLGINNRNSLTLFAIKNGLCAEELSKHIHPIRLD